MTKEMSFQRLAEAWAAAIANPGADRARADHLRACGESSLRLQIGAAGTVDAAICELHNMAHRKAS